MARMMLEEPGARAELQQIKEVTGEMYLAGVDTTKSAVEKFFLAMLVHPEVQAKAQAEIDRVVGRDRLPDYGDQKDLPYVQAVVSECLRWLPIVPQGACAGSAEELTLTLVQACPIASRRTTSTGATSSPRARSSWALSGLSIPVYPRPRLTPRRNILHNPLDYPEPERFHPERYLTPEGTLDPSVRDPRSACFGFGRRMCPGRFVADATLFGAVATLLATLDVVRAKDANGVQMVPQVECTSGIISYAQAFPWAVRVRNERAGKLLAESADE
jgi:cytochrome P450